MEHDLLIRGIGELVTMEPRPERGEGALGVIEHAALAARDGVVVWLGPEAELTASGLVGVDEAVELDAAGAGARPGFVAAHTHTVFAGSRADEYARRLAGATYGEILAAGGGINDTVRATRAASLAELTRLAQERLDSFLLYGTTTVEIKSGYGLTLEDERKQLRAAAADHPVRRRRTFLGAHATPPEYAAGSDEYIDLVCAEMIPALAGEADFVDVFCDVGAFDVAQSRKVLEAGRAHGLGLKIHADELAASGGGLLAAELGCASADHLVHLTGEGVLALAAAGVVAVLLPGTSFTLRQRYAPARALLDAGTTVALATDFNPGTCLCENMQMMIALACQEEDMTPAEALRAATLGGAAALGMSDEVGSLAPGKRCDVTLLATGTHRDLPYHFGVNLVDGVLVGGELAVAHGRLAGRASATRERRPL